MIRIQPLPASDGRFAARVREALERVSGHAAGGGPLCATGEAALRRALADIRLDYPDVWIRRQDPIASIDGVETWYAFRDEAIGAVEHVAAGRG